MDDVQVVNSTLEEIKDLLVEGETAARGLLISTYLQIGNIIIENNLEPQRVANYIGRSERSVEYMVAFAKKPEIADKLTKADSWHKIVKTYLTTPKELEAHQHEWETITRCSICKEVNYE